MRKAIIISVMIILTALLLLSGWQIWSYFYTQKEVSEQFESLAGLRQIPVSPVVPELEMEWTEESRTPPEWTVYDQYGSLFEINSDMAGWICIDGTTIDYPVMYTPDRPNFYLKCGFDKEYSDYGVPYIAESCAIDPQSDNVIIYGHNMDSGMIFGALESYMEETFWREHAVIRFDTRAGFGQYRILAVFRTTPEKFSFHTFIYADDQTAFDDYIRRCRELSFYDTGVAAEYGDNLLTISTCEYSELGSRLVVVAVKV